MDKIECLAIGAGVGGIAIARELGRRPRMERTSVLACPRRDSCT